MTMPARQVWLFQLGCWTALAAAALHVVAHVTVGADLSPHARAGLALVPPAWILPVPGLRQPTYVGIANALSVSYAVLLATIGMAGLAVVRHGQLQSKLLRAVAGRFAIGAGLALVVSVLLSFSLQTFVLAVVAMCFALAAVPPE